MAIALDIPETAGRVAELIYCVRDGEEILLAQNGVAIARLVPIQAPQPRIPGQDKGKVTIAPDFNAPLPDYILSDFLNSNLPTS